MCYPGKGRIQSVSQHYKVFVEKRIAEIQELIGADSWRYVDSDENPADDITRRYLAKPNCWTYSPTFLHQPPVNWPANPAVSTAIPLCGATPAPWFQI